MYFAAAANAAGLNFTWFLEATLVAVTAPSTTAYTLESVDQWRHAGVPCSVLHRPGHLHPFDGGSLVQPT